MEYSISHRNIFSEIFNHVDLTTLGRLAIVSKEISSMVRESLIKRKPKEMIRRFNISEKDIELVMSQSGVKSRTDAILALGQYRGDLVKAILYLFYDQIS